MTDWKSTLNCDTLEKERKLCVSDKVLVYGIIEKSFVRKINDTTHEQ